MFNNEKQIYMHNMHCIVCCTKSSAKGLFSHPAWGPTLQSLLVLQTTLVYTIHDMLARNVNKHYTSYTIPCTLYSVSPGRIYTSTVYLLYTIGYSSTTCKKSVNIWKFKGINIWKFESLKSVKVKEWMCESVIWKEWTRMCKNDSMKV